MFASAASVVRFPDCPHCPIRETASPPVCLRCAAPHLRMIEPPTCPTCGQHLDPEGACPNKALCRSPNRALSRVEALAALEGELERRLRALKYGRETSWALVLGRLLAIVLRRGPRLGGETPAGDGAAESAEELAEAPVGPGTGGVAGARDGVTAAVSGRAKPPNAPPQAEPPELVVANPTWTGPPAHQVPHAELLAAAAITWCAPEHLQLPAVPVLVKLGPSRRSAVTPAGVREAAAREHAAACVVRPDADLAGRRVVLVDDVCTSGWQLEAVAELLRTAGACQVRGVVLARTPWRGRPLTGARREPPRAPPGGVHRIHPAGAQRIHPAGARRSLPPAGTQGSAARTGP